MSIIQDSSANDHEESRDETVDKTVRELKRNKTIKKTLVSFYPYHFL